jgi:replication factor A1
MKIEELNRAGLRSISVTGQIVDVSEVRNVTTRMGQQSRVADAVLRDETGEVDLTLWDSQIDSVKVGDNVSIQNGYTTEFRGRTKLNVGRYGTITKVEEGM